MNDFGLSKKDLAILRELDQNVRASYNQIGKKARLSKEVVQYRIKRLEEKKIITGYWALLKTRYSYVYKILIKNRSLSGEQKKDFIKFVLKQKNVSWFASSEGNYDFVITVYEKEDKGFVKFAEKLLQNFGSFFHERQILRTTNAFVTNDKYLYPQSRFVYSYKLDNINNPQILDETDQKILTQISLNSRAKMSEIAKKVNLTPEAVSYRHNNLKKKNIIIGLKPRIDFEKMGLSYYHLFVTLQDQKKKKEILSYYTTHPDSNSVLEHIGFYDLHIEFIVSQKNINKVMDDFSAKFGRFVNNYELLRIRKEHTLSILK